MATAFAYTKRPRRPSIPYPDLGPWAGVLFLLCTMFMSAGRFAYPAPPMRLPVIHWSPICSLEENYSLTISIDAMRRAYIAINSERLQAAVIQRVAEHHHVGFTNDQLQQLQNIPFLSQDIQRLPAWLSASRRERQGFPRGIPASSNDDQLSEYIATSDAESRAIYNRPIHIKLRADESLRVAEIKHIMQLLQKHGINYINFVAEKGQNISIP